MSILSRICSIICKGSIVAPVRLCKDCKHLKLNTHDDYQNRLRFAKCARTAKTNLVGCAPSLEDMTFCSLERAWKDHECGPSAKYFEPKP